MDIISDISSRDFAFGARLRASSPVKSRPGGSKSQAGFRSIAASRRVASGETRNQTAVEESDQNRDIDRSPSKKLGAGFSGSPGTLEQTVVT
ncbi:hypothetical protein ACOSP7_024129 [Xanthoceras sorbifolium]